MADIIITKKRQVTELKILVICFILSIIINIIGIAVYKTSWSELYTQIVPMLIVTVVLYTLFLIIRLIYFGVKKAFLKKK